MRNRLIPSVLALSLILAACGTDGGDSSATSTTPPSATTTEGVTSTTQQTPGIHTADSELGTILVNAEGFTLYVFTNDSDGVSVCNDACADLWPPVPADSAIGSSLDAGIFGSITRDDGSEQLAINGRALYLYTPDTSPGDTNGQGFNDVWFVVDQSGSAVEAAADGSIPVDYDY